MPSHSIDLVVQSSGRLRCVYQEQFDLSALGPASIRRASHVEPTADGAWTADLAPVGGPVLGPYACRSAALAAELNWLRTWLPEISDGR